MLAKVVKLATGCREANYCRDMVKIRNDSSIRDNRNIMNVIYSRIARKFSKKKKKSETVEKTASFSRGTSNSRNSQPEH
jgi:hypothetical protein